ncbi:4Fe-4S dicluster domain-containing protein [bacterium 1xD8-6]|nr:4Fe-4S dicluster domain-containing protein [bacterium D16-36]RKI72394.1 4Fe-4S dicluster domain-containing protein [bacterium 1xD8-6]
MNVGIMTWFQYHNYGTALQVVALSRKINDFGHNACVVNYTTNASPIIKNNESLANRVVRKSFQRLKNHLNYEYHENRRELRFDQFYDYYLEFTDKCETLGDFELLNGSLDAFVCGSDQIWSPPNFNPRYFLDFVYDENRMIAYAPSVGILDVENENIRSRISENISRFKYISTREKAGSDLLSKLTGQTIETVLDPTLLLTQNEWHAYESDYDTGNKPYLLAYMLGKREEYWKIIKEIADNLELELYIIPFREKDIKRKGCIKNPIGPGDFLKLLCNADYICTDSFHGTVFSINYNKPFTVFERFKRNDNLNQNSRIYNILGMLELEEHLYQNRKDNYRITIDYSEANNKLESARSHSLSFLGKSLASVQNYSEQAHLPRNLFFNNKLCCGCGACKVSCPTGAIQIALDADGFYVASVDHEKCISCGKCSMVCPYLNIGDIPKIEEGNLFSYKDREDAVLMRSSSGGAAFKMATTLLDKGYSVVGCAYNKNEHFAEHIIVTPDTKDKLKLLQGSKYMQSKFYDCMKLIGNSNEPIVVFGTPCQIAGVKNIIGKRNDVFLVDLVCHGVPTYGSYKKYLQYLSISKGLEIGNDFETIFRFKPSGWRRRYIYNGNSEKYIIQHQSKDPYFLMFEHGFCYSKGCYECPWRNKSASDIRLGDYWGDKFAYDITGVSMVCAFTEKGRHFISQIEGMVVENIRDYTMCQQMSNFPRPVFWEELVYELNSGFRDIEDILKEYVIPYEKRRKLGKMYSNVVKMLHRK